MANPFLMDDDPVDSGDSAPNPFLLDDAQQSDDYDNSVLPPGTNPFAFGDDGDDELEFTAKDAELTSDIFKVDDENSTDPAMSFFGTTIQEEDNTVGARKQSQDQNNLIEVLENKKNAPPPRPSPPSQTTQDLICAVAGQLDEASSTMLDRIPVTRTPSPVSMRDLVSPSPTTDLFDVNDETNDNPFEIGVQSGLPNNTVKPQPPRPPPPRPAAPPRPPAPPATVSVGPVQATPQPQNTDNDLFDMFGTTPTAPPKPPPPKSNQDILSLFDKGTKPPIPPKPDLLSDELVLVNEDSKTEEATKENEIQKDVGSESILDNQQQDQSEPIISELESTQEAVFSSTLIEPEQEAELNDNEKNQIEVNESTMDSIAAVPHIMRAPTPDIEITTVGDRLGSDEEDEFIPHGIVIQTKEPEVDAESNKEPVETTDYSFSNDSNFTNPDILESHTIDNTNVIQEPEEMDTTLDFAPASGSASANPFASPEDENPMEYSQTNMSTNIFMTEETSVSAVNEINTAQYSAVQEQHANIFGVEPIVSRPPPPAVPQRPVMPPTNIFAEPDEFDAFAAKFDSVKKDKGGILDGFASITPTGQVVDDAWGSTNAFGTESSDTGFGAEEADFEAWAPESGYNRRDSVDSIEEKDFNVVIRPKDFSTAQGAAPALAPPPRTSQNNSIYSGDSSPKIVNPFDQSVGGMSPTEDLPKRTDSQETPPTPLFDDDVSQPLEDFPRLNYTGQGWEMQLRQPNKKKITGQRFWKKIYVKLLSQGDVPVVQLFNQVTDKTPFQELPLQPSYSVSEIAAQQFDQFGKIFTLKLQYIFYKERPGVRPGQITKAERITNKLSQFAQYAIAGDYAGVKEFGSDLKKLGLPVEHAPQSSQLAKLGTMTYEDLKQFSLCIEEALFKISAHRDRALTYKMEEVQVTAVDEIYVEQDYEGHVHKQIARVRLFFLAFLSGMPTIELGLNDMWRQGKEVVGRHDIIPVVTEEWIRLECVEFHNVVQQDEYERSRTIKFQPPDACYIELMRFRVRPPKNRELPLQLKASWCVTGNRVELKADILVPGFASRKLGQIPCEDVSVRFPIPECWIYLFRVEKHFRYGSVKSAHRRTGKIKGIERILGAVDTLQESLIEVTSGQAKYEHHHRAIVWRCPRLPKEGQGAYTTHQMVCRMALTSYDQIPEQLAPYAYVEFTMPATQVSHTTVRSVSVQDSDSDEPPEKYVRYLARHEYRVGIETTQGESVNAYLAATKPIKEEPATTPVSHSPALPSDSDSDSN